MKHVILLETKVDLRECIREGLKGCNVTIVESESQAKHIVETQHVDAVVSGHLYRSASWVKFMQSLANTKTKPCFFSGEMNLEVEGVKCFVKAMDTFQDLLAYLK